MKKIALLTSGGDAPGMNAAVRAITRAAIYRGLEVVAFYRGFRGLVEGDCINLRTEHVSNIIQRGGTILLTARCEEFFHKAGRAAAYANLTKEGIDGLIVVGGNGTLQGALLLSEEFNFPVVGVPATIDNDLFGTSLSLGYTTALNTIVDAVDKIRDTASSHERIFFVEVMGRHSGFLALNAAIASGCEAALVPEVLDDVSALEAMYEKGIRKTKTSSIVLVAEGEEEGGAIEISRRFRAKFPHFEVRYTILGHIQRGGIPCATDRILGGRFGLAAVEALLAGHSQVMVADNHGDITLVPFQEAISTKSTLSSDLFNLLRILSI